MAWCPKCKLEYRDGITVCADCGSKLVDQIEEEKETEPIMTCESEELADKFIGFLSYSNINSGQKILNENTNDYTVFVEHKEVKEAKKLFRAFYTTEVIEADSSDTPDNSNDMIQEEDMEENAFSTTEGDEECSLDQDDSLATKNSSITSSKESNVYVKRADKYNDLASSAKIFYAFGVVGLIYVILNAVGVLSIINGVFPYVVYTILFIGCIVVGFTTQKSANKTKAQIKDEEDLTSQINQWLSDNISESAFADIDEESTSDEIRYLNRTNFIKEEVMKQFPNVDDSYADQLVEDFYNEKF